MSKEFFTILTDTTCRVLIFSINQSINQSIYLFVNIGYMVTWEKVLKKGLLISMFCHLAYKYTLLSHLKGMAIKPLKGSFERNMSTYVINRENPFYTHIQHTLFSIILSMYQRCELTVLIPFVLSHMYLFYSVRYC